MRMLSILFLAFSCLIIFPNSNNEVSAKSGEFLAKCRVPTFAESYRDSSAVFAGKILSVRKEGDERIFTFQVEKYWKGKKSKNLEVRYYETMRYQVMMEVGEKYLVFARKDEQGNLSDGRCSLTEKYSDVAGAFLKKLGKGKSIK